MTPGMLLSGLDFVKCLDSDVVLKILSCLDDPADLVRASLVSHAWRDFVIANDLSKQLCVKWFPQLSNVVYVTDPTSKFSSSIEVEIRLRDHKVYAYLLHALTKLNPAPIECIKEAFSASSTDRYPAESIVHTLDPVVRGVPFWSYWSSKGRNDPSIPETLIYKLKSNFCVISEIGVEPFEASYQTGRPIYSARSVKFRMGHPKSKMEVKSSLSILLQEPADDEFIWTYTSPEFPMAQETRMQHFKLPEPVLCIGGYVLIELLGRVQTQASDGLYYICISHVKVLGRPLSPAFDVEVIEPSSSGKFVLQYFPDALQERRLQFHEIQSPFSDEQYGFD
ncbi:OLC1v1039100C1 [Oldenlandia corymbosa var. corymbosa]|uniref:OLC1v1039100C1 n=1 Tax=Oldenlandia corymbosa var. corymbosa TaxID=529605 RepID=A0AAV1D2A5_OLDCO|nr:OLC1v1039100C1 [Oldenlandia corymbosa var. corymbosa]